MTLRSLVHILSVSAAAIAFVLICGVAEGNAQGRDPFSKPSFMKPRVTTTRSGSSNPGSTAGKKASVPVNYGPPAVEARIEYFKHLREQAAANGQTLPKVTSVLTLSELNVTGIFKTPRGYAAMVEAVPIKLSYTIYPGEKFFDGQLVAVEENRLVFKKVTKTGPGKFVASVENKPLQQYTTKSQIEGTAPAQAGQDQPTQVAAAQPAPVPSAPMAAPAAPAGPIVSPVDEMEKGPQKAADAKKPGKKPVRAANKKNF